MPVIAIGVKTGERREVKLVISHARRHEAPLSRALTVTRKRDRVHAGLTALAGAAKSGRRAISALIVTTLARNSAEAASTRWRALADLTRPMVPGLATIVDDAERTSSTACPIQ